MLVQREENRIAIADLGTNTFHLLIAERQNPIRVIFEEKVAVGLGKGGINDGIITEEACERALDCMRYFSDTISTYDLNSGIAIGTSALRSARNGAQLAEEINNQSLFKVEIIDGNTEASYILNGVQASGVLSSNPGLIVDIGGGSVEFIIATQTQLFWKQSFEIGGIRLMEKFQKHDPIAEFEIQQLQNYLINELSPLVSAVAEYKPTYLVGSSGAFDTLAEMHLATLGQVKQQQLLVNFQLPLESFSQLYSQLIFKNRDERMKMPGMIPLRVDMIVVAVVLIQTLLQTFGIRMIRSCTYALKEGVACYYFENGKK